MLGADVAVASIGLPPRRAVRVSGRAGRLRASFRLWNDESDVASVVRAVRETPLRWNLAPPNRASRRG